MRLVLNKKKSHYNFLLKFFSNVKLLSIVNVQYHKVYVYIVKL